MPSSSEATITVSVTYRGVSHPLSLLPDTTLALLQTRLEEITHVLPVYQKLLYKGKKNAHGDMFLIDAGIKNGAKIQMLGSTREEIDGLKAAEDEKQSKERIMRERATRPHYKVRSTASPTSGASSKYRFHRIEPLGYLPNPSSATSLLQRLAGDPAILHVMQKHQFSLGTLTELAPHEQPHLLGLNVNAGQAIKLRIRTDAYDGFRAYKEIRRVLCHELTHNVHGEHNNDFKALNSQLNRELTEYEQSVSQGTHRLMDAPSGIYEPTSSELEAEAQAHVLGGSGAGADASSASESREDRRRRVLEATMNRLRKEEEELEHSCGTAGPSDPV